MAELTGLDDLLAPVGIARFFQEHWEKALLWIPRRAPDYYADLLTSEDIDRLLQSNRLPSASVKAVKDGKRQAATGSRIEQPASGTSAPFADQVRLYAAFSEGATLVIDGGHHTIPPLNRFCVRLESQLRFPVQANLYITPPRAQGLQPHFDTHDVMVLQVFGCKDWRLYGRVEQQLPVAQASGSEQNHSDPDIEQQLTLETGDLLYLPRGLVHASGTADSPSVHIALGLKPDLRLDLLRELVECAGRKLYFRRALPHGLSSEQDAEEFVAGFRREMSSLVEDLDVDELMRHRQRVFVEGQLRDREGLFGDLLDSFALTPASMLTRRSSLDFILEQAEEAITVRYGAHQVSVPPFLQPAVAMIVGDRPFAIDDLPGLITDRGKIELVREFLRTGFLRVVRV